MGNNTLGFRSEQFAGTGRCDVKNRTYINARAGWLILALLFLASFAVAETVRVATFNVSMGRRGPGVLLKDVMSGGDKQILAVAEIIQHMQPDILLLNEFDNDHTHLALNAFRDVLGAGENGILYPYFFAAIGNEGQPSGLDMDGDGRAFKWSDALGFGRFPGSEGMVILSRYPLDIANIRTFSKRSWQGLDTMPEAVRAALRLPSKSHWDIPVLLKDDRAVHILASHPTPPVFDDDSDLNGLRNSAEIRFWVDYLEGDPMQDDTGQIAAFDANYFVLLGDLNSDPTDGEGHKPVLLSLLRHGRVQDPLQSSSGGRAAALRIGGANARHLGDPMLDTVEWDADIGNMRVDYALPSRSFHVTNSGVFWPPPDDPNGHMIAEGRSGASNHRLVWVDLNVP